MTRFVVTGGSKRGWDRRGWRCGRRIRVIAIAPMVIVAAERLAPAATRVVLTGLEETDCAIDARATKG